MAGQVVAELAFDDLVGIGLGIDDLGRIIDRARDVIAVRAENAGMSAAARQGLALVRAQADPVEAIVVEDAASADDENPALERMVFHPYVDGVEIALAAGEGGPGGDVDAFV